MTTKTVEELAEKCALREGIDPNFNWTAIMGSSYCPHGSLYNFKNIFLYGYRTGFAACEEKLAAGDGAYNLGYERAMSRFAPRKIDLKDKNTWPPLSGSLCKCKNKDVWEEAFFDAEDTRDYFARTKFTHWLPIPKIEGEE